MLLNLKQSAALELYRQDQNLLNVWYAHAESVAVPYIPDLHLTIHYSCRSFCLFVLAALIFPSSLPMGYDSLRL